jgi:hypothetical protein
VDYTNCQNNMLLHKLSKQYAVASFCQDHLLLTLSVKIILHSVVTNCQNNMLLAQTFKIILLTPIFKRICCWHQLSKSYAADNSCQTNMLLTSTVTIICCWHKLSNYRNKLSTSTVKISCCQYIMQACRIFVRILLTIIGMYVQ